jgi:D-alanyl-D-alanine carboxypeptidase/D-alanyl-D-alanine-endopeptidase (penicillin-binding protein 4)
MRSRREARSRPIGTPDYQEARHRNHGPVGPSSPSRGPIVRRRAWTALGALLASLVLAAPAGATLGDRLARALATPWVSSSATGAWAYDLAKSKIVYRHNQFVAYRPASSEKLTVAVTALDRLGPGFRIATEVFVRGSVQPNGVLDGSLVLKGYGDPWLRMNGLRRLATKVRNAGITRVTGPILGDESYFDRVRVGPGWKPSFYKVESPPLSALVVNNARVGNRMWDEPAKAAARLFRRALRQAGIAAPGSYRKGLAPAGPPVARIRPHSLAAVVRRMDLVSDNFFAEMLMKLLGKRERGEGSTAAGAAVVRSELRQRIMHMDGVRIADGSGLSRYDRLTARAIGELLISAISDSEIDDAFVASLPVAGVSGTLKDRMERLPAYRHVFAKTGTTSRASALSGYVTTRYVFSILQNGNPIPYYYARQAQDRFAQVLAGAA